MSEPRYKLVIDQPAYDKGNDPQVAEGALPFVIAALHEWSKFPRSVTSLELKRV
jgi:hypothetical protein